MTCPPPVRSIRARLVFLLLLLAAFAGCRPAPVEPIPILMYHHIAPDPGRDVWTLSSAEFQRQITGLRDAGYQTILPGDLARPPRWPRRLPRKPIVITFDDGLHSTLVEAEPVLREAGFQAIVYLITGLVADTPAERRRYRQYDGLTWEEVRAMQTRGTLAFGIHSHSHTGDAARQALEVAECRRIFRDKTGTETRHYCYPYGAAPDLLVQAVRDAGYLTAMVCEDRLFSPGPDADLFRIPRVSVYGGRHDFAVAPRPRATDGSFIAYVQNLGLPLPVLGRLRHVPTGQIWPFTPGERLGYDPQRWQWSDVPSSFDDASLQVEIWEQNGLFRYHP
jgi:peptidoglycan/xylan/chitin deacetylase (PgdA/CDA1 family)